MNKTKTTRTRYDFHVQNYNDWDWDWFIPRTEAAKAYLYLDTTHPNFEFGHAIAVDWKQIQSMAKELHDAGFKLKRPTIAAADAVSVHLTEAAKES